MSQCHHDHHVIPAHSSVPAAPRRSGPGPGPDAAGPGPGPAQFQVDHKIVCSMAEKQSLEAIEESLQKARSEIAEILREHQKAIVDGTAEMQMLLSEVEKIPFATIEVGPGYCSRILFHSFMRLIPH
jgi:hypothetical protein